MNARSVIEAEDPKHFLRHVAPPKEALIICPVQGDEQHYWSEQDQAYYRFSAALVAPQDMGKIPEYFEVTQRDEEKVVYDAADLYITELLQLLHDKQVHVIEAYEVWPNQTMMNPYPLGEAEDPKSILRKFSSNKIWPSENYYLNVWPEGSRWQDGEFCPGQVNDNNEFLAFDGMYGLIDEVYQAMGVVGRDPTEAEEEQFEKEMDRYDEPMYSAIKRGETSGSVDGIAGRKNWQLVYQAPRGEDEDYQERERNFVPGLQIVRPGQQYGPRITPRTDRSQWRAFGGNIDPNDPNLPEALAQAVLEGEDPKALFKANFGQPQGVFVIRTEWIDPHYPPHDEVFDTQREAVNHFRKMYLKMGGGEWHLKLMFRPDRKVGQPPMRSRTLISASYDRGDQQLMKELKAGVDVFQAFRDYKTRTGLSSQIYREADKKFPNTGEFWKHHLSGKMVRQQTPEDWFQRDDYFRAAWRQRAGHPPDCQCYNCQQLQRPTAREYHADLERRKADAYRRWKRAVARAKLKGQPPPPEPRHTNYMRGPYDY